MTFPFDDIAENEQIASDHECLPLLTRKYMYSVIFWIFMGKLKVLSIKVSYFSHQLMKHQCIILYNQSDKFVHGEM